MGIENPAAGAPRQCLPIDIESGRVRGFRPPFHDVKPPRIVGVEDTHVIGNEVQNEAHISRCEEHRIGGAETPRRRRVRD